MDIRPALTTGGSLALGVLALAAVQSGLTLAMTPGPGGPPAGWPPMPDPADGDGQGTMDEEFFFWDNQTFYTKMGLA